MTDDKGAGIMGILTVNGRTIEAGEDGYPANADDWNEDVAGLLAGVEGLEGRGDGCCLTPFI